MCTLFWLVNVYVILVIKSEERDCLQYARVYGIIILKLISNNKGRGVESSGAG